MALLEQFRKPPLAPSYREELLALSGGDERLVRPFDEWQFTTLPHVVAQGYSPDDSRAKMPYVRLGQDNQNASDARPLFLVAGFSSGINGLAALAVLLARNGHDVILPGHNRTGMALDNNGAPDATLSQAENLLTVFRAVGLEKSQGSVHLVAHSYGSLLCARMIGLSQERRQNWFDASHVVLLDPAGLIQSEHPVRLAWAAWRTTVRERTVKATDITYPTPYFEASGLGYIHANHWRSMQELWEIARRRIDLERLLSSGIGCLAIVNFRDSDMFPQSMYEPMLRYAIDYPGTASVSWTSTFLAGRMMNHNAETYFPKAVGGLVHQLLQHELPATTA